MRKYILPICMACAFCVVSVRAQEAKFDPLLGLVRENDVSTSTVPVQAVVPGDGLTAATNGTTVTLQVGTSKTGNFAVGGNLTGQTPVTFHTDASVSLTAAQLKGALHINGDDDVLNIELPVAAVGLYGTIANILYARVITIDCVIDDQFILEDGTAITAGNAIDSTANAGVTVTIIAIDDSTWKVFSKQGVWSDGGAD